MNAGASTRCSVLLCVLECGWVCARTCSVCVCVVCCMHMSTFSQKTVFWLLGKQPTAIQAHHVSGTATQ